MVAPALPAPALPAPGIAPEGRSCTRRRWPPSGSRTSPQADASPRPHRCRTGRPAPPKRGSILPPALTPPRSVRRGSRGTPRSPAIRWGGWNRRPISCRAGCRGHGCPARRRSRADLEEELLVAAERQDGGGLAPWIGAGGKADRIAGQDRRLDRQDGRAGPDGAGASGDCDAVRGEVDLLGWNGQFQLSCGRQARCDQLAVRKLEPMLEKRQVIPDAVEWGQASRIGNTDDRRRASKGSHRGISSIVGDRHRERLKRLKFSRLYLSRSEVVNIGSTIGASRESRVPSPGPR